MPMLWHAYIIVGEAANIDRGAEWVEGWLGGWRGRSVAEGVAMVGFGVNRLNKVHIEEHTVI